MASTFAKAAADQRLILALAVVGLSFQLSALGQTPKKLLFLTHAALYKHTSLGPAEKAVIELGKTGGYEVTTVEGYAGVDERGRQGPDLLHLTRTSRRHLEQRRGVPRARQRRHPMGIRTGAVILARAMVGLPAPGPRLPAPGS